MKALILAILLGACRCNPFPADPVAPAPVPEPTIPPIPWGDGGAPEPEPHNGCSEMCERLAELRCASANPTASGATCIEVCRNILEQGTTRVDFDCIINSRTCAEAEEC